MTTIAYDGRYIAGDGRSTVSSGMIVSKAERKITLTKIIFDGEETEAVIGASGSVVTINALMRWLEKGGDLMNNEEGYSLFSLNPDPEAASMGCIVILKDGRHFLVAEELVPFECELPLAAGSGTPFAMVGMSMGLNATQAVHKAMEFDIYSGGEVICFDTEAWEFI